MTTDENADDERRTGRIRTNSSNPIDHEVEGTPESDDEQTGEVNGTPETDVPAEVVAAFKADPIGFVAAVDGVARGELLDGDAETLTERATEIVRDLDAEDVPAIREHPAFEPDAEDEGESSDGMGYPGDDDGGMYADGGTKTNAVSRISPGSRSAWEQRRAEPSDPYGEESIKAREREKRQQTANYGAIPGEVDRTNYAPVSEETDLDVISSGTLEGYRTRTRDGDADPDAGNQEAIDCAGTVSTRELKQRASERRKQRIDSRREQTDG